MKRLTGSGVVLVLVLLGAALDAAAQTVAGTANAATVKTNSVTLTKAADGTWSETFCASLVTDTGWTLDQCETFALGATVNINRALALEAAGTARWLRRQGFAVDAGAP